MLATAILSESTIVRCVIPLLTNPSAHQLPTPPTPKRITFFEAISCINSEPSNSSVRANNSLYFICFHRKTCKSNINEAIKKLYKYFYFKFHLAPTNAWFFHLFVPLSLLCG